MNLSCYFYNVCNLRRLKGLGTLIRLNNNYSNQGSVSPPKFQFRMQDKRYPGIVRVLRANSSNLCLLIIRGNTWQYNG